MTEPVGPDMTPTLQEALDTLLSGEDPEQHLPGVAAHLRTCGPCAYDYRSLIDLVTGEAEDSRPPGSAGTRLWTVFPKLFQSVPRDRCACPVARLERLSVAGLVVVGSGIRERRRR